MHKENKKKDRRGNVVKKKQLKSSTISLSPTEQSIHNSTHKSLCVVLYLVILSHT